MDWATFVRRADRAVDWYVRAPLRGIRSRVRTHRFALPAGGPVCVELGSGYHPTPGYVHVDANPRALDVDVVADVRALGRFPAESVDELRAVDVLEHVSYRETGAVLREWTRILKPGARLYVQVPDAGGIMRAYAEGRDGELVDRLPSKLPHDAMTGVQWRLLGGHADGDNGRDDWRLNAHYALFSAESLIAALSMAGFDVQSVEVDPHPNLCAWAVRRPV